MIKDVGQSAAVLFCWAAVVSVIMLGVNPMAYGDEAVNQERGVSESSGGGGGSEGGHGHEEALKNADGSWKYTNALAGESSPYLRQHMHNPVDWRPWGPEAFELARRTGKPIFLSIGYSTCYWCHVMEREVFENPELAAKVNERFVCVKVDREERPEVDDIYMTAVQVLTGRGGWPMSVFLTPPGADGPDDPGLKPFWAATYIPPEPAHGMPGFGQVVEALGEAWKKQREGVLSQAQQVAAVVADHLSQRRVEAVGESASDLIQAAANQMVATYDPVDGGFGGAPKFPQPCNLLFLMKVYRNNPNPQLWKALAYTLERMARGGMYDQVGGGFHRYSTDERWLVPHFEKMLYDNAQLVEVYAGAQEIQKDESDPGLYARVVRETCDYVLRELTWGAGGGGAAGGGGMFWSAQDAEVDGREGLNYLWTEAQAREAAGGGALADWAVRLYGLDEGTNFQDPHHPEDPRVNVLFLPRRLDELARKEGVTLEEVVGRRGAVNEKLLAVRSGRKQPSTDDKVITSWNGMMIAGMARAGRVVGEPGYIEAAGRAAGAVLAQMGDGEGGVYRTMREGRAKIPGFLEDYAYFVHGLLELHRARGERRWLDRAVALTRYVQEHFSAAGQRGGGYYDTLAGRGDLFVRAVSVYDGAVPSGNSQMVHNLLDLYEITGDPAYLERAVGDLRSFLGPLKQMGQGMAHMQHALLRALEIDPERFAGAGVAPGDEAEQKPASRKVIHVEVEPELVDLAAGPAAVTVRLDIGSEYHVNAHEPGIKELIPTELRLVGGEGLKLEVEYPKGELKRYPFADQAFRVYEGEVEIKATIRRVAGVAGVAAGDGGAGRAKLVLRYQICTERSCLDPKEVELPVVIEAAGGGR